MDPDAVRVVIVDDEPRFLRTIQAILATETDIEVVAEASDGEQAVQLVTEHAPEVVLMDVRMPVLDGIDATRVLSDIHPSANVVMLTVSDDEADVFEAIKAGASGYLLKDVALDDVANAVREARDGDPTLSPVIASRLFSEFASMAAEVARGASGPQITNPELQVLQYLSKGRSAREIGMELSIPESRVKSYMRNIIEKFHIHARIEAAVQARLGTDDTELHP